MMGPIDPPYMAHGDGGGVTWANEDSIRSREDIAFWRGHAAGLAARPDGSIEMKPVVHKELARQKIILDKITEISNSLKAREPQTDEEAWLSLMRRFGVKPHKKDGAKAHVWVLEEGDDHVMGYSHFVTEFAFDTVTGKFLNVGIWE